MGQAVLDLPDPLEKPAATAASADDLLSQLAGDEIDRLLAESEKGQPLEESMTPADAAPVDAATIDAAAVDAAPVDAAPPVEAIEPLRAEATEPADAAVAVATEPAMPAMDVEAPAVEPPIVTEPPITVAEPVRLADADRERHDLLAGVAGVAADAGDDNAPLPLWLRPLEWLSAPFAHLPESTRDFLGKAAIITLINSAAIVGYVLFLRKG